MVFNGAALHREDTLNKENIQVLFLIQNKIKTRERERILALNKIILEFLVNFFKALI